MSLKILIQENAFDDVFCKMAAILLWPEMKVVFNSLAHGRS